MFVVIDLHAGCYTAYCRCSQSQGDIHTLKKGLQLVMQKLKLDREVQYIYSDRMTAVNNSSLQRHF